jgi:peptide/nickel transport system substrate-binding protein
MRKGLVSLFAVSAIAFAACGGSASPSPSTPVASGPAASGPAASGPAASGPAEKVDVFGTKYAPEDGPDGGQIIFADWQEATQYNPFYVGQVSEANVAAAVWASTVVATNDYKWAPDLAKEIPTIDNGEVKVPGDGGDAMTVTWTLKPDLKWSDGQPLTCDDFKYAWEWVLDPKNVGVTTIGYEDITAFDCPDASTMVLHYKKIFEGYITQHTSPLPRHYLKDIPIEQQTKGAGFKAADVKKLPVSGAFKIDSVTPQAELRLVRNDNYKSPFRDKPAHLDTLIFKWYADADAMIAGFKGGEADGATDLQDSDLPKLKEVGIPDANVSAIPAFTYEMLTANWSPKTDDSDKGGGCTHNAAVLDRGDGCPMSDPAMRQAIAYAVDKNEINSRILSGQVVVANTLISPDAWFYADQTPTNFDIEKAKGILDAAGWVPGADGTREKGGVKARIELCTTSRQSRQDTLALVAAHFKEIGIDAVINPVSPADIFEIYNDATRDTPCSIRRSNFDLAEFASSSSLDPLGFYTGFHSSQFYPVGANQSRVADPDIDAALDQMVKSVDFNVIKTAMAQFQKVYVEKAVEVPLYYRKNVDLKGDKLGNFTGNPTQFGPTWNVWDWFAK